MNPAINELRTYLERAYRDARTAAATAEKQGETAYAKSKRTRSSTLLEVLDELDRIAEIHGA